MKIPSAPVWLSALSLVFFVPVAFAAEFGIVTYSEGRAIAVSEEGNPRIIRNDSILNDGDTVFTERETKVTLKTLDGSLLRIYEASQLELLETMEINEERFFRSKFRLAQGALAAFFSLKAGEFNINFNEYRIQGGPGQFLFLTAYRADSLNLISPLKGVTFKNDLFSKPLAMPEKKALTEYGGDILNVDRSFSEPKLALKVRLDREDLEFREDELRNMLISIQLVESKTSQNFPYRFPLFFFSNIPNLELPQELLLNKRGYANYEIKIPQWIESRTRPENLILLVIADFSSGYTIYPGLVELPFVSKKKNKMESAEGEAETGPAEEPSADFQTRAVRPLESFPENKTSAAGKKTAKPPAKLPNATAGKLY